MDPLYTEHCLAFQIEGQDIKGRIIRLDKSVHDVLARRDYSDDVSRELGQAMALAALLGSMMKFDGILTLQLKSDGVIRSLVSDFATDGGAGGVVRGYCATDQDTTLPLLGAGQLMITMDQGKYMERYQGIVNLKDHSLRTSAEEYFRTSEQLPTRLEISCNKGADGRWSSAAIMIQHLARNSDRQTPDAVEDAIQQDNWNTAAVLLSSVRDEELLDKRLSLQDLLMRLYHESGVRVFAGTEIRAGCRCSEEKLRTVLSNFKTEELKEIAEDGVITMTCEFCKTDHKFELRKLIN